MSSHLPSVLRHCPTIDFLSLLLSATNLVLLSLCKVPHSTYFSAEAVVTCFSALAGLETLYLTFESPRSRLPQESRLPPPLTRSVLPTLTKLQKFAGVSEYLEDLVARIGAPLFDYLDLTFFHQLVFDTPRVVRARSITHTPKLKAYDEALVCRSSKISHRRNRGSAPDP